MGSTQVSSQQMVAVQNDACKSNAMHKIEVSSSRQEAFHICADWCITLGLREIGDLIQTQTTYPIITYWESSFHSSMKHTMQHLPLRRHSQDQPFGEDITSREISAWTPGACWCFRSHGIQVVSPPVLSCIMMVQCFNQVGCFWKLTRLKLTRFQSFKSNHFQVSYLQPCPTIFMTFFFIWAIKKNHLLSITLVV